MVGLIKGIHAQLELPMLLELLIAGHLQTYEPKPEPEVIETPIVQVIEPEESIPAELPLAIEPTLEEKIKTNFYQCDTNTHYIRADNAQCLAKPIETAVTSKKPVTGRKNAPQAKRGHYYQCAGWVASKRYVPEGWGNAISWKAHAQKAGWYVGSTPIAGAIGWRGNHVVYLESVNSDGTVTISEQNYDNKNSIRTITVPVSKYTYLY